MRRFLSSSWFLHNCRADHPITIMWIAEWIIRKMSVALANSEVLRTERRIRLIAHNIILNTATLRIINMSSFRSLWIRSEMPRRLDVSLRSRRSTPQTNAMITIIVNGISEETRSVLPVIAKLSSFLNVLPKRSDPKGRFLLEWNILWQPLVCRTQCFAFLPTRMLLNLLEHFRLQFAQED